MVGRHDNAVVPCVVGEGRQFSGILQCLCGNADVGCAFAQHGHDLVGARLVQHEVDLGKLLLELGYDFRQRVAGLRVCGGHAQLTLILVGELFAELFDVLRIEQDAFDNADEFLPRLGETKQPLTFAHEQFDAKLVLQILDVFGDAGLGRI